MTKNEAVVKIQDILVYLYDEKARIRSVVEQANLQNSDQINFDQAPRLVWKDVLHEADRQNKIFDIIFVALKQYSQQEQKLREAYQSYLQVQSRPPLEPPLNPPLSIKNPPNRGLRWAYVVIIVLLMIIGGMIALNMGIIPGSLRSWLSASPTPIHTVLVAVTSTVSMSQPTESSAMEPTYTLALLTPTPTPLPTTTSPPTKELIGHWTFDECDGTDNSDNAYHGNVLGNPECVDGVMGKALKFDGVDDWVSLENAPEAANNLKDFSISIWFKTDQDRQQTLIQSYKSDAYEVGYMVIIRSMNNIEAKFTLIEGDAESAWEVGTRREMKTDEWHQVVMTRNTNKGYAYVYLDGEYINSDEDPYPELGIESPSFLKIGFGRLDPSNYETFFYGLIDDIRIYGKALTGEEIQALYKQGQSVCTTITEIPQIECETLVALYNSTSGPNWITETNWLATNTPCGWYGVTCDSGHVTKLSLPENGLMGPIPSELGKLFNLSKLNLRDNNLSGPIPLELGQLMNLQDLYLQHNQLTDTIPSVLGNLTQLEELYLWENRLIGPIPAQLGDLVNLNVLHLARNPLGGSIPSELSKLKKLQTLDLSETELTGPILPELGNLVNLKNLTLGQNQLSGPIPETLDQLTNLECLHLNSNQLSGNIPALLMQLEKLKGKNECFNNQYDGLDLGYNHLVATEPALRKFLEEKDPDWEKTQTPTNLIVANFNSCASTDNLGGSMGAAYNPPDQMKESYIEEAERGCVVKLEYAGKGWGALWMKLQGADLSQYSRLTFDIKADPQLWIPERMKIELKRDNNREMSIKYIGEITADWQTIVVELADFGPAGTLAPLSAMTEIEELSFVLESNGSDATGVIYLDNVAFMAEDGR